MTAIDPSTIRQAWPRPSDPRPIVLIGAGGIVNDAHLPAYAKAGFPVAGIYDPDVPRAEETASRFELARVFSSLEEAISVEDAVFDVAVPPQHTHTVVSSLPRGATALLQKPIGSSTEDAHRIQQKCHERGLIAAVNFQLRFAPMMLAIKDLIDRGALGDILDLDLHLACRTPWESWPFMSELDHVEVPMHSIHYLDWIRSVLGEPDGVYSRSVRHPAFPDLNDARTSTILDYGDQVRCCLSLNHTCKFGPENQDASITIEGTLGAARVSLGLLLNYPQGEPETLTFTDGGDWIDVPINGRWFPDGFVGVMSNLQRFAAGEDPVLHTRVDDARRTMSLVAACGSSSNHGGVRP